MPAKIRIKVKDRWINLDPSYYFTVDVDKPGNDRVLSTIREKKLPIQAVYRRVSPSSRGLHYIVVSKPYIAHHHDFREIFGDDPIRLKFDRRRVEWWEKWEGEYYPGLLFDRKIKFQIKKGSPQTVDYRAGAWERVK